MVHLLLVALAALAGAAVNSIAGGGTLLTFPALLALGIPPVTANATSTVALWTASLSSVLGYRSELAGAGAWTRRFAIPSVLGGLTGAILLLATPERWFERLVPWLILGATALFALQGVIVRFGRRHARRATFAEDTGTLTPPPLPFLLYQFVVAVYGGYFGAGMGILMLAALGFMGLTNIHRMNGLKNMAGTCINATAACAFAVRGVVNWPVAGTMAVAAMAGGYLGARMAQRVPQVWVRRAITAIGVASGLWLLLK